MKPLSKTEFVEFINNMDNNAPIYDKSLGAYHSNTCPIAQFYINKYPKFTGSIVVSSNDCSFIDKGVVVKSKSLPKWAKTFISRLDRSGCTTFRQLKNSLNEFLP